MTDDTRLADPSVTDLQRRITKIGPRELQPTHWLWVLCLLGVDYFSTLAYQPSITFEATGLLGPPATLLLILLTLFGALPVYLYVAKHSPHGQGSIALLERLVHGWAGKTLILILLGFAATDFVMLKTISLADAAEHLIHNSYVTRDRLLQVLADEGRGLSREHLDPAVAAFLNEQLVVTILLGVLGFVCWFLLRRGFNRKVIVVAAPLVGLYLLVNGLVIAGGLWYLAANPERLTLWYEQVRAGEWLIRDPLPADAGWGVILLFSLLFLPQLSLGLSGFEMSLIVMPQVKGRPEDDPERPEGRIRNTRKVLITAALIMSSFLLGAVLVTTLLVPPTQFGPHGQATNRALAYLASGGALAQGPGPRELGTLFGPAFGALYDLTTIVVLCLAGTSVMTALASLLPRFLLRFGMELKWANRWGVLFTCFAGINLAVTVWFRASVREQRGAYATGVLALIFSACAVTVIDRWRTRQRRWLGGVPIRYGLVSLILLLTLVAVVVRHPSGLLISGGFIGTILASSVLSRALRTDELRTIGFEFVDTHSRFLWDSLRLADFPVLVPHRPGWHERKLKEEQIRRDHQLVPDAEIVFLETAVDDPSNFYQKLLIEIVEDGQNFVIKVTHCVSVAHAIAAVALELSRVSKSPALHFGWSDLDLLAASWSYLAFGEGNVPWKVRELLIRSEPDREKQPRVVIG